MLFLVDYTIFCYLGTIQQIGTKGKSMMIYLSDSTAKKLKKQAKKENRKPSEFVERLLKKAKK